MTAGDVTSDVAAAVRRFVSVRPASAAASDAEIAEEIAFHIAERARELRAGGLSEAEADRAARDRFGDPAAVADACRAAADGGVRHLRRLHAAATAALAVAVAVLTARAVSVPRPVETVAAEAWTGDVSGTVCDESGRPLSGADVLVVVKAWPGGSYFQRAYAARSGADGGFRVAGVLPEGKSEVAVAAAAPGSALVSAYRSMDEAVGSITLALPDTPGVEMTLADEAGPLRHAEVLPRRRRDAAGSEHQVYFDAADPLRRLTDAGGRVRLPYLRPGDRATLMVRPPGGDWRPVEVALPGDGPAAVEL